MRNLLENESLLWALDENDPKLKAFFDHDHQGYLDGLSRCFSPQEPSMLLKSLVSGDLQTYDQSNKRIWKNFMKILSRQNQMRNQTWRKFEFFYLQKSKVKLAHSDDRKWRHQRHFMFFMNSYKIFKMRAKIAVIKMQQMKCSQPK